MFKDSFLNNLSWGIFEDARIKLTAWYLLIIMGVSISFSGVIYINVNRELKRIENYQQTRIEGLIKGIPISMDVPLSADSVAIQEARIRFLTTLGIINLLILIISGIGGYFLAGQTLEPIAEMMQEQKDFVSNASHELRTPLTSLMTEIEVALRDKNATLPDTKKLLRSNLEEVKKMNNLSNYLLKLNKLQDGKVRTDFKPLNLKTIAEKVIKKIDPIAQKKEIKITQRLSDATIKGNEDSIDELITIFLDNAIKYTTPGGKIEIITLAKGVLKIKDSGVGIATRDIPHIFDRFYRAESSRSKERTEGYGLGLSIAKSIIDLHNASVRVHSRLGKGTAFSIYF